MVRKGIYLQVLEYRDAHCGGPYCPAYKRKSCRSRGWEVIECMVDTTPGLDDEERADRKARLKKAYLSGAYYYRRYRQSQPKPAKRNALVPEADPETKGVYEIQQRMWGHKQ